MPSYRAEQKLDSCDLSRETAVHLERYILDKAQALNQTTLDEAKARYKVEIVDSIGKEQLQSIDDYKREGFPNDIQRLVLSYFTSHDVALQELKISFAVSPFRSDVEVGTAGPNAKETATGILGEVRRLLQDHRNLNFLFFGNYAGLAYGCLMLTLYLSLRYILSRHDEPPPDTVLTLTLATTLALAFLFWKVLGAFSPYVAFETRRNEKSQDNIQWVLRAIFAIIVLGWLAKQLLA